MQLWDKDTANDIQMAKTLILLPKERKGYATQYRDIWNNLPLILKESICCIMYALAKDKRNKKKSSPWPHTKI